MDALFSKPTHKTVWAQLRGKPVLQPSPSLSDVEDKIGIEQREKQ